MKIRKKVIRILCMTLAISMLIPTLAGCKSKKNSEKVTTPEELIMNESFERNEDITKFMTFRLDYMTNEKKTFNSTEVVNLFEHMKIQVDGWDSVVVGISTMKDVAAAVDKANEEYVKSKTDAVIKERQAQIDEEYARDKAAAEAKGKTYTKEKKVVQTDDIHFDNPYSYTVTIGTSTKTTPSEYEPTRLVDPKKNKTIYFDVSKYGIPYVRFYFTSVNYLYNYSITQESDWIMNGVHAADVSNYKTSSKEAPTDFVDVDGLNKAAKKNIVMSGGIAFGGEGFTWDSLMVLCDALQLQENGRKHGFSKSSDQYFTYYTIYLYSDPFEYNEKYIYSNQIYIPITKLVATFDPLSQICVNWKIDTYSSAPGSFKDRTHDLTPSIDVNVHEYLVDTNDYAGMRKTINDWISANAEKTTTSYCAIDTINDKMFGIVSTGRTNATVEPIIDGVKYQCLSFYVNGDGSINGDYISVDDALTADGMEDTEANQYIESHKKKLRIAAYVLDSNKKIIGQVTDDLVSLYNTSFMCKIVSYEKTDSGYKNVKIIKDELADELLLLYSKTYMLNDEQNGAMQSKYYDGGFIAVREYIDDLFGEAEEAQKNKNNENHHSTDSDTQDAVSDSSSN